MKQLKEGEQIYIDPGGKLLFSYVQIDTATKRIAFIREAIDKIKYSKTTYTVNSFEGLSNILWNTEELLQNTKKYIGEIEDRTGIE